jgi:hypothetical protein
MSDPELQELDLLLDRLCEGGLEEDQLAVSRLVKLVDESEVCRRRYLDTLELHATLWRMGKEGEPSTDISAAASPATLRLSHRQESLESGWGPLTLLGDNGRNAIDYVTSSWPVAYLVAAVVVGTGLVIGAVTHVSQQDQTVNQPPKITKDQPAPEPNRRIVGRITGMVDCQWVDDATAAISGAHVPLGRKYALTSGLMEITYDTGAKVILQGRVIYEAESKNGGFLSIGKLTGRVEVETAKGFSVRTPAAVVTDLGTEFGVEVDKRGVTTSHVYRGIVKVQPISADRRPEGVAEVLRENMSARVDIRNKQVTLLAPSNKRVDFVRSVPRQVVKPLDLVDIVAGGNGFSGRRNRGIDPTTGQICEARPDVPNPYYKGDYKYHRVEGLPFVDGVFIPDGSKGPVQVDSAGHTFDGFPKTANVGNGIIWTGTLPAYAGSLTLGGVNYTEPGHGALVLYTSKGITFDLKAIRRANPGCRLLRFSAVAGNTEIEVPMGTGTANLWVLVDGQVRWRRREINGIQGAMAIVVAIQQKDRFLTLVADDAGSNIWSDSILFGDPRIEFVAAEP